MKINRYKKVNRALKFYANHFGFRKPYQVLLDGTICVAALKHKVNIHEQFTKYLDGNAKLLTTQCIIKEVERLGSTMSKALYVLKNFGQHQCGHDEKAVPASDCIMHMIESGADSRYVVATQDRELQGKCRKIPGVPLLYFHMRVPTLEAPSEASQRAVTAKASVDANVRTREKDDSSREVEPSNKRNKRKIKGGPNPLSCKKKKKKSVNSGEMGKTGAVKKRRKNHCPRLVKRIKNELSSTLKPEKQEI